MSQQAARHLATATCTSRAMSRSYSRLLGPIQMRTPRRVLHLALLMGRTVPTGPCVFVAESLVIDEAFCVDDLQRALGFPLVQCPFSSHFQKPYNAQSSMKPPRGYLPYTLFGFHRCGVAKSTGLLQTEKRGGARTKNRHEHNSGAASSAGFSSWATS